MKKALAVLMAILLLALFSTAFSETAVAQLQEMYASAELKMAMGDYAGAAELFDSMGSYSDCSQMAMYCKAISAAEAYGLFDVAIDAFSKLGEFKDCPQMIVYYTGRAAEAVADIAIENLAACTDEQLSNAISYLTVAEANYKELALFKDCMNRLASCSKKKAIISDEQANRNDEALQSIYDSAMQLESKKKYREAIELYATIEGYKDTVERIQACWSAYKEEKYNEAVALREDKKWDAAIVAFKDADDYSDAKEQILATRYMEGIEKKGNSDWDAAVEAFKKAGEYSDAKEQITDTYYLKAADCYDNGHMIDALKIYQSVPGYKDADVKVTTIAYEIAGEYEGVNYYREAEKYYDLAGDYLDSKDKSKQMQDTLVSLVWYPIRSGGKFGYCTQYGEVVMECQWTAVDGFDGGVALVQDGKDKYGAIDKQGNYVFEYDSCPLTKVDGYIRKWNRGHKYGLYNYAGECIFEMDQCSKFYYGEGIITYLTKDYELFFYDVEKKKTVQYPGKHVMVSSGFSDGWCVIYDYCVGKDFKSKLTLKEPLSFVLDKGFHDGLLKVESTGKNYGYVDTKGKLIIPCEWGYSSGSFSEGFVNVQNINGKWCYLDTKGNKLTEVVYDSADPFSEGFACVSLNGKKGYIDQTGAMVIELQFDEAYSFTNGLATVEKDGEQYYINQNGERVMPRDYQALINMIPVF